MKDYIAKLQQVIQHLHGCESVHVATTPIREFFQGKRIWDGEVETFAIKDHPKASTCYAWVHQDDQGKQHYTAVLRLPPVNSPQSAVKAAIAAQGKNETEER
jgi:hypothetical protein